MASYTPNLYSNIYPGTYITGTLTMDGTTTISNGTYQYKDGAYWELVPGKKDSKSRRKLLLLTINKPL